MSVILKIDPSKKDVIINNHNGITINNSNVSKRKFRQPDGPPSISHNVPLRPFEWTSFLNFLNEALRRFFLSPQVALFRVREDDEKACTTKLGCVK